jgi:hypothetical protein
MFHKNPEMRMKSVLGFFANYKNTYEKLKMMKDLKYDKDKFKSKLKGLPISLAVKKKLFPSIKLKNVYPNNERISFLETEVDDSFQMSPMKSSSKKRSQLLIEEASL